MRSGAAHAVILDCVLAECVYVLLKVYQVDRRAIAGSLRELLTYRGFTQADRDVALNALGMFETTRLSIVDCLLCARSRSGGIGLLTFDEAAARRSRAVLKGLPDGLQP